MTCKNEDSNGFRYNQVQGDCDGFCLRRMADEDRRNRDQRALQEHYSFGSPVFGISSFTGELETARIRLRSPVFVYISASSPSTRYNSLNAARIMNVLQRGFV